MQNQTSPPPTGGSPPPEFCFTEALATHAARLGEQQREVQRRRAALIECLRRKGKGLTEQREQLLAWLQVWPHGLLLRPQLPGSAHLATVHGQVSIVRTQ